MTFTKILAWHGDADLKAVVVARMRAHRAADTIIQGFYQETAPGTATGYRGCAIGCTLPPLGDEERATMPDNGRYGEGWWLRIESEYAIPYAVAELIDKTFELQTTFKDAAEFAVAVIEAIPVGADLTPVVDAWHEAQVDDAWHKAQMYDAAPRRAARWLVDHLTAAPIPAALP